MHFLKKMAVILVSIMLLYSAGNSFLFADSEEKAPRFKKNGPIPLRNQMPLYLFYLQMIPDKAEVVERNKFIIDADYTVSNITASAFTPATSLYTVEIDMEVSRVTLDFRYGVYDNLEIGIEVPYISLSSGYIDNFIEGIEDGLGARTPRSRERQGSYEFDYLVRYNTVELINKKHSTQGIGDIIFTAKYQFLKEEGYFIPNISLRSAVKFPTAEEDDLLGSGEMDYGAGLLIDKTIFGRLCLYLGGNVMFIEKPDVLSIWGIDKEYYSGMVAIEYLFTKRFSVIAQAIGNSTPYPYSNTNPLDNEGYDFVLGFNYRLKGNEKVVWDFSVAENINAASSPDVSFLTGLRCEF